MHILKRWNGRVLGVVAAAGFVGAAGTSGAWAQESAAAGAAVADLEEVVVTARKREETLLEVPVAVTAITAADIESKGIESLQDVAMFTPGLTYFDSIQNQLGTPVIRGISQTNLNSPDRNVAIFYGGVYLSNTNAANLEILDVERIEVVKGPQSALYGRNAFNGAINYVPAAPTSRPFAKVEGTVGTDSRYEGKVVVSGPLSDRFRGRLAASYNTFGGTYENARADGPDIGGYETRNVSGSLAFDATDNLDFRLFGYYTDDHRDPSALYYYTRNNCGPNPLAPTAFCGEVAYHGDIAQAPLAKGFDREVQLGVLDVNWRLGPVTVVSQTSQYDVTTEAFTEYTANGIGDAMQIIRTADVDALVARGIPRATAWNQVPTIRVQNVPQYTGHPPVDTKAFSQELRLESDAKRALRGSVGAFFYRNETEAITAASFDANVLAPGETVRDTLAFVVNTPSLVTMTPRNLIVSSHLKRRDYQRAVFGGFELDFLERFRFGAELRRDKEDRQQYSALVGTSSLQRKTFEYNTWRTHLDYALAPTQRFYVSAAKGVISGYFNPTVDAATRQPLPLELQSYNPAENKTYEIGWKAEWLERRLATELTAFYIDYTGLQINAAPPPPAVTAIIQNLGKVRARGVEASLNWRVDEHWRMVLTYGYSPTEFGKGSVEPSVLRYCGGQAQLALGFCPTLTFRGALAPDMSGQSLPRAPEMNASAGVLFDTPLQGEWSLFARADASYTSKSFTMTYNIAEIPARTLVNARVGLRRGENLELALWGRNVFDEKYVTSVLFQPHFNQPIGVAFTPNPSQGDGATFGLTASYRFR